MDIPIFYTALLHIMFDLKLEKSPLLKILAYGLEG